MENHEFLRSIDENTKKRFANSINSGLGQDLNVPKWQFELQTFNYKGGLKWDLLNTALIRDFDFEHILFSIVKRGPWEFIIMLDKRLNILYTFMKEDRLEAIRKIKIGEPPHYYNSLATLNDDIKPQSAQLNLPGINKFDEKYLSETLTDLCKEFGNSTEILKYRHVIVTFSSSNKTLQSLNAVILNSNFDLIHNEPWNEYITPDFESILPTKEDEDNNEDNEIKIELKSNIKDKSNNEDIISLIELEKEQKHENELE